LGGLFYGTDTGPKRPIQPKKGGIDDAIN